MNNKKFYQRPIFWFILLFVYSVILVRHNNIGIYDTGYGRGWYYGDAFSDINVESASKFYMEHGLKRNYGLPTYKYTDTIPNNEFVYTHYPPMAEWIGGVFAKTTKHYDFKTMSIVPLLLSVVLFFMIFHILSVWLKNDIASFVGASLLVLSNYFIAWADDTHQHVYVEFYRWLFVYVWWFYLSSDKKNKWLVLLLAFSYAMMSLHSFEPYVYIAIITLGFPIALRQKLIRWEVALLLLTPVVCFAFRLWLSAEFLGSVQAMINDMTLAYKHRTGTDDRWSEIGRVMSFWDYIQALPETRLHRLGHFYSFPSLVVVMLAIIGLIELRRKYLAIYRVAIVIYIASISWMFIMPQHALIHIFTLRHIGIFLGLAMGLGIVAYWKIIVAHFHKRDYLLLSIHSVILIYSLTYFGINTFYFLYVKYGWCYPKFGTDNFELVNQFLW